MGKFIDLTGQKFGRLTVIGFSHSNKHRMSYWLCECECGNTKTINSSSLKCGSIKSCRCLQREISINQNAKHGHARRSAQTRVSVIEKEYGVDLGVRFVEMVEQLTALVFVPNHLRNVNVDVAINKAKKMRFGN